MTPTTHTFPLTGHAASVVECVAEEILDWQDNHDIAAVVRAFRAGGPYLTSDAPRRLVVTRAEAEAVADGLCDLANGEDDMADANTKTNPELARYNRAGQRGLSTVRSRVLAWMRA